MWERGRPQDGSKDSGLDHKWMDEPSAEMQSDRRSPANFSCLKQEVGGGESRKYSLWKMPFISFLFGLYSHLLSTPSHEHGPLCILERKFSLDEARLISKPHHSCVSLDKSQPLRTSWLNEVIDKGRMWGLLEEIDNETYSNSNCCHRYKIPFFLSENFIWICKQAYL